MTLEKNGRNSMKLCQSDSTPVTHALLVFLESETVQAPVFIEQPSASSSIVAHSRTKFLQCKAKGMQTHSRVHPSKCGVLFLTLTVLSSPAIPQAQYRWIKDGEPLSEFKDAVFYKISNAARNDSGSYQCLAQNVAGTIFSEKSEVIVACKDAALLRA